jgi:hypothetical protein
MDGTYELHTCCDLCVDADGDCLTFAQGNGSLLDFDTSFEWVREAYGAERVHLYNALVKAFKDYDLGWKNPTDSTYLDILDWLAWEFNIELSSDKSRPGPVEIAMYEIQDYIWDAICKETDNYQEKTLEPEMVNKQEFIEKARKWLNSADMRMYVIADHTSSNINRFDTNKFISDFIKTMEE